VSGTAPAAAELDTADDDLAIVGPILPDAILDVLSAQISYRKALLTSPDRAVSAMEEKVRMLFDVKRLVRPVHLADNPLAERKLVLRNLDGYKEMVGVSDGAWLKSKARVFADGSKQLPEFTAESSSPVARIESILRSLVLRSSGGG
jgi:hypothetical protein